MMLQRFHQKKGRSDGMLCYNMELVIIQELINDRQHPSSITHHLYFYCWLLAREQPSGTWQYTRMWSEVRSSRTDTVCSSLSINIQPAGCIVPLPAKVKLIVDSKMQEHFIHDIIGKLNSKWILVLIHLVQLLSMMVCFEPRELRAYVWAVDFLLQWL